MNLRPRTTILAAVTGVVLAGLVAGPANAAGTCDKPNNKPATTPAKPARPAESPKPSKPVTAPAQKFTVAGTLSAIDAVAGTVTVTGEKGAATVVKIAPNATISLDKAASTLANLPIGAQVRLSGTVSDGVSLATTVDATSSLPFVTAGVFAGYSNGEDLTITVQRLDATETLRVAGDARITLDARTATLADLPEKARIVVFGTSTNGIRTAKSITALSRWQLNLTATVSAVDAANGTITVTTGKPATSLKLAVNPDATVRVNGVRVALKDLPVGATVSLTGSETTAGATITGIDAKVAAGVKKS